MDAMDKQSGSQSDTVHVRSVPYASAYTSIEQRESTFGGGGHRGSSAQLTMGAAAVTSSANMSFFGEERSPLRANHRLQSGATEAALTQVNPTQKAVPTSSNLDYSVLLSAPGNMNHLVTSAQSGGQAHSSTSYQTSPTLQQQLQQPADQMDSPNGNMRSSGWSNQSRFGASLELPDSAEPRVDRETESE
jgi:hypothetical protein